MAHLYEQRGYKKSPVVHHRAAVHRVFLHPTDLLARGDVRRRELVVHLEEVVQVTLQQLRP